VGGGGGAGAAGGTVGSAMMTLANFTHANSSDCENRTSSGASQHLKVPMRRFLGCGRLSHSAAARGGDPGGVGLQQHGAIQLVARVESSCVDAPNSLPWGTNTPDAKYA
jgi:hypothetical protein